MLTIGKTRVTPERVFGQDASLIKWGRRAPSERVGRFPAPGRGTRVASGAKHLTSRDA